MTAAYLYCIVKSARKPSISRAPKGLPETPGPELLPLARSLWLVVTDAPLDTYGAGHLEQHLADMDWVGRIALAHEEVVEHFARKAGTTVIPMKLFTMFSSRDRAIGDVSAKRRTIEASMRRIAGAEEWGIRVMRGEQSATKERAAERPASGAAFLAAKKQARDVARSARIAGAEAAAAAFTSLSKHARDARRRDDAPASGATPPLLDAAFLVTASKKQRFLQTARREAAACAAAGAHMTLSGPWPAYNFVQADEESR